MNFQDVQINLGPVPGKNICLTFYRRVGGLSEFNQEVMAFTNSQICYLDAEHHRTCRECRLFFQSVSDEYFMIEFWTDKISAIQAYVRLLQSKFSFPDPVSSLPQEGCAFCSQGIEHGNCTFT